MVETADNHTLYAHWIDLKAISSDVFTFTPVTATYKKGVEVSAEYEKSEAYADLDGFTFEYRKQSDPNAMIDIPVDAGVYDIVVKRPADNTYAQFEYRYQGVVVINKAIRTIDTVELEANKKGYTFLDLKPAENAIDDLSDKAKFTYEAVKISGSLLIPGDSGSSKPGSSYIGGLKPATDYHITVKVTDDPNYEDATSTKGYTVRTLKAPTESWRDHTEALSTDASVVYISTPGQLAMLAKEINEGKLDSKDLKVELVNDIDLTGYIWEPIGSYTRSGLAGINADLRYAFRGIFDGAGHTIRGLYVNGEDYNDYYGLFGFINDATVKNLKIEESYLKGNGGFGGIVGYMHGNSLIESCISNTTIDGTNGFNGGIVGDMYGTSTVRNCVNYGNVSGYSYVGGIAGQIWLDKNTISIINCVNYGNITGEISVGGIAGRQIIGSVINNANFGNIVGTSANTGGIVGENDGKNAHVYNCYTAGTVTGSGKYVGAVVGRNNNDNGKVVQCYYLAGSATCDGKNRSGLGTEKDSVPDGNKGYQVASFTSASSALSRDCGYGKANLMSALTKFIEEYRKNNAGSTVADWVEGKDGYPILKGLPAYTQK